MPQLHNAPSAEALAGLSAADCIYGRQLLYPAGAEPAEKHYHKYDRPGAYQPEREVRRGVEHHALGHTVQHRAAQRKRAKIPDDRSDKGYSKIFDKIERKMNHARN